MRRISTAALCAVLASVPAAGDSREVADDTDGQVAASRAAAKAFGMQLKGELQQAMQEGGTVTGITVCNERATQIAADTSRETGLDMGRTSLKVRNPDNEPDGWELEVLTQFEQRKAAGEAVDKLEYHQVVTSGGKSAFRYMKAIPTGEVCLACHGDNLAPELTAKLEELYPDDTARGFKMGDIRGAFTISRPH